MGVMNALEWIEQGGHEVILKSTNPHFSLEFSAAALIKNIVKRMFLYTRLSMETALWMIS
jgi:hypothetical protein